MFEILFDNDISEVDIVKLLRQDYKQFFKENLEFSYGEDSLIFSICK